MYFVALDAIKADDLCFNQNSEKPNPYGNCGEDGKGSYVQCKTELVVKMIYTLSQYGLPVKHHITLC